jgi:3-phosphoglycerate kinase
MGGAKISTKLKLIKKILPRVDFLLLGGGLANNFLRAMDWEIGRSIYERRWWRRALIYFPEKLFCRWMSWFQVGGGRCAAS